MERQSARTPAGHPRSGGRSRSGRHRRTPREASADGGLAVGGCERERLRTLVRCEELLPSVGFERVTEQGESSCGNEEAGVAARERPGRLGEMAGGQDPEGKRESPAPAVIPSRPLSDRARWTRRSAANRGARGSPAWAISATSRPEPSDRSCTSALRATSPRTRRAPGRSTFRRRPGPHDGPVRLPVDQHVDFPPVTSKRDTLGAEGDRQPIGKDGRACVVRYHDPHLHQILLELWPPATG